MTQTTYQLKTGIGRKIFIHSIPRPTASGIHNFRHPTSGKPLNKTKIGRATTAIVALYDPKVGGLKTGLYKPWIEGGKQKIDPNTQEPLTLQDKYEKQFNLPKGYLTHRALRKGESVADADTTYFQKAKWKLQDGSTVLDLDNFDDLMGYHVALESKRVANSEKERLQHMWPKAGHVITIESESEDIKLQKNETRGKAVAALHAEKMTSTAKKKFVYVLDLARSTSELSDSQVYNLLFEYIQASDFNPGSNIDKFNELVTLNSNKIGREELEARFLLKRALDSRVMFEKADSFIWPRPKGTLTIGETYGDAILFLINPKKEVFREELEETIKAKLK